MRRFHFGGGPSPRPAAERVVFVDGSADASYRDGIDLELSHWVPNRTPAAYKADTSTAICLEFAEDPAPGEWDLVVNNHVDTDGLLAVFALVHPELALRNRDALVAAATMGDFWGWGDEPAQVLYETLALARARLARESADPNRVAAGCLEQVAAVLAHDAELGPIEPGLRALAAAVRRIESGEIRREPVASRLSVYTIAGPLSAPDLERALHIPRFDAPLSETSLLPPRARNRFDRERLQLVSVAGDGGWFHDLHFPGYVWAETPDSWRPDGLVAESSNAYRLESLPLSQAARELQRLERSGGRWTPAETLTPFETLRGRGYPVVLSFMKNGQAAPSSLPPRRVADVLVEAGLA